MQNNLQIILVRLLLNFDFTITKPIVVYLY